jgi:uncharacterized membrane protein YeaQ/YmgE (transglycosylase-associated protein family)
MTPGAFLAVFVAGLITAWLAAFFLKDGGHGLVWDILLALVGSALAYWIGQVTGMARDGGVFASMLVAFVGAASLIGVQRKFWHGAPLKNAPLKNGGLPSRRGRAWGYHID